MIERMPALFVGHGSPMNAIEDNEYSRNWSEIAKKIKRPEAILAVSAHWFTDGTLQSELSCEREPGAGSSTHVSGGGYSGAAA